MVMHGLMMHRIECLQNRPVRLSYSGNTFVNTTELQGRLKESTQLGAELYNDSSVNADAEMVCLIYECMKKAGFGDFVIAKNFSWL